MLNREVYQKKRDSKRPLGDSNTQSLWTLRFDKEAQSLRWVPCHAVWTSLQVRLDRQQGN